MFRTIDMLHAELIAKATDARVIGTAWLRTDTTMIPADIKYPTRLGILETPLVSRSLAWWEESKLLASHHAPLRRSDSGRSSARAPGRVQAAAS